MMAVVLVKNTNQRNNSGRNNNDRNNSDRNNSDRNNSDRGIYLQSVQYHFHSMFTNAISTQINFSNALAKENEKRQQHNNNNTRKKNNNSEPRSLRPAVPARLTWVATMERHRERTKAEPLSSEMLLKERLMEMNTGGLLLSIRSKSLVVDITRCLLPVVPVLLPLLPLLVRVFLKFNTAECFSLSWVTNIFKAGKRRRQRQQRDRSKKKTESAFSGVKQHTHTHTDTQQQQLFSLSLYLA